MLEHLPSAVGAALKGVRPGLEKLTLNLHFADVPQSLTVESSAFQPDAPLPVDATEDGRKISPPFAWRGVPPGAAAIAIMIEDADSPTPEPLVHTILLGLPGRDGRLAEGELKSPGSTGQAHVLGRNSFLKAEYLPPDPPSGHGPHRYAFQVFALATPLVLASEPGRGAVIVAMTGHVLATGMLIGTYER